MKYIEIIELTPRPEEICGPNSNLNVLNFLVPIRWEPENAADTSAQQIQQCILDELRSVLDNDLRVGGSGHMWYSPGSWRGWSSYKVYYPWAPEFISGSLGFLV